MMLISAEKNRYKEIDADKTAHGKFFTSESVWLTKPVHEFVMGALAKSGGILDPFAGDGHLLDVCSERFGCSVRGLDILSTRWPANDSLRRIENKEGYAICTNPPYLARYSASRKGLWLDVEKYLEDSKFEDLYQVALMRCLEASIYVVAIVPETFLHSTFPKRHLVLVSVLEVNPFLDTDEPTCVACFDVSVSSGATTAKLYKGDQYCLTIEEMRRLRGKPSHTRKVKFNDPNGRLGLRAVDSTDPAVRIGFYLPQDFEYCRTRIKHSSRLLTYVEPRGIKDSDLPKLIAAANRKIANIRALSHDLALSPFKGNNAKGVRRRRLDYELARVVLEQVIENELEEAGLSGTLKQLDAFDAAK